MLLYIIIIILHGYMLDPNEANTSKNFPIAKQRTTWPTTNIYIYLTPFPKKILYRHYICTIMDDMYFYTVAATVSPPPADTASDPAAAAGASFFDVMERLSFLSSSFICCCLHSRLQNALSPLKKKRKEKSVKWEN